MANTAMPDPPPPPPPPPSFSDESDRYTALSADLINKFQAVQHALVCATAVRRETLATLSSSFEDPRGPPPIPEMVRSFAPVPSGADMAALTAQLRRRVAFDAFQMASHLLRGLAAPLARARAAVRSCHRAARYRRIADADDDADADDGLRQQHLDRLRGDVRAVRRAGAVVGRAVEAALCDDPARGELRWFDYVVGVGSRRTEERHRWLIESVYGNIAGFEELGHSYGDDMRYLVTACREFQGLLAKECLGRLVEAVKTLEEAWGRDFVWEKRGDEAREAERAPEPVEGVTWEPPVPESTEGEGEDVRSDVATNGDEDGVSVAEETGVALRDIQMCRHDDTGLGSQRPAL